jgi:V-type H+-transporting ATPase subunit C
MEAKTFWLVSAPNTKQDTFNTLNKHTADENDFSVNYKFQVPDLRVGTLDSLMALSDDLGKIDAYVENVTRKIATQLYEVIESKTEKFDSLTVNNNNIDTYLTFFRWDEAKYPTSQSLKALTVLIQVQTAKLDEELKAKATEYTNLMHNIYAEERKAGGNLVVKDLTDIVTEKHVIETEYLETLFVAVPRYAYKQWLSSYEKLTDFVLPRSSLLIEEDSEYGLYRVVLFRRVSEDFKNLARERKFTVRDFKFDPNRSAKNDKKRLEAEKEKQRKNLIRWAKTNFSEAFIGWIHLKAIRVFVESVLRYGLPTNFQAMLLLPHKGKATKLRKCLGDMYSHLSSRAVFRHDDDDNNDNEKFYPYVFLEISLDFRPKNA